MALYDQNYVNQLVKEAAAQAGGTLSYADAIRAAGNLGITPDQIMTASGSGLITGLPTAAPAPVETAPAQTDRQKEVDQWVYSKEPKAFQDLYKAVQSGEARIGLVPDEIKFDPDGGQIYGDYGVFDANGKFMPDVRVDPDTGALSVGTKNGVLRMATPIGAGGVLSPIKGENYQNQVKYESFGNTWDEWGPAILGIGSLVGAPYLSSLIGGATGLTGANLAAATGATLGGTTGLIAGGDLESALKGALLGGAGGYLVSSLTPTDLGMNSQLTPAAIEAGLGTPGYGFNASAAQSGLFNPAMIGAGAYTQTSYPYDMADFLAADVKQLYGQFGSNIPAIEQNLVASGVDPLVAADVANQVTLNPNISQYDLTNYIASNFGGNVYDVNMATQYPTSPGTGGSPVNASIAGGLTAGKVLNTVSTVAKVAGLLGAGSAVAKEPGKGFEIVPIPSDWRTPTYTQAAARTLPPIDFGTRELLRGTQWEKFLNPAQPAIVPAPQVGMNYGDLMNVLQNRQGGTLTLNDIISGITSQYGQTTPSAVG